MARAVAAAPVVAEYLVPLLNSGGEALLYRGQWGRLTAANWHGLKPQARLAHAPCQLPDGRGIRHVLRFTRSATAEQYPVLWGYPAGSAGRLSSTLLSRLLASPASRRFSPRRMAESDLARDWPPEQPAVRTPARRHPGHRHGPGKPMATIAEQAVPCLGITLEIPGFEQVVQPEQNGKVELSGRVVPSRQPRAPAAAPLRPRA